MRLARIDGRPALLRGDAWVDVAAVSRGRFADEDAIFAAWPDFLAWAGALTSAPATPLADARLDAPRTRPRQVFGAGLNYHSHLAEASRPVPEVPLFFTKFPSSICGPDDDIVIATDAVDFEAELVVVMGRHADRVPAEAAWEHVAGLTVGQDISARDVQRSGQLSLGKSFRTFAPIGPWITTLDELGDPADLSLSCAVNGEKVQECRTSDMVFGVPRLIALLSAVTALYPGDLIFTGTCDGVGVFRDPHLFLRPGDVVRTEIEGLGSLTNRCVADDAPTAEQQLWGRLHRVS